MHSWQTPFVLLIPCEIVITSLNLMFACLLYSFKSNVHNLQNKTWAHAVIHNWIQNEDLKTLVHARRCHWILIYLVDSLMIIMFHERKKRSTAFSSQIMESWIVNRMNNNGAPYLYRPHMFELLRCSDKGCHLDTLLLFWRKHFQKYCFKIYI